MYKLSRCRHLQTYKNKILKIFSSSILNCRKSYFVRQYHLDKYEYREDPPWRILFFGSDHFAVKSLQILCSKLRTDTLISKLNVVTTSAKDWHGKKNPIYQFAENEELTIHHWPIKTDVIKTKYDLGVVVSFGHLIPAEIIECFPLGILNVHGSLLPKWRGPAPIIHAVLNDDSVTGVTIMKIHPHKFDTGDIVKQYSIAIKSDETAAQLTDRLAIVGAQLLMECIRNLPRSVEFNCPQPNEGISYAKKATLSMAMVKWDQKSARCIYNQYRALSHLFPLYTYWNGLLVKLFELEMDVVVDMNPENLKKLKKISSANSIIPGLVEFSKKRNVLRIQCKDGKWVKVGRVVISNKHGFTPNDFYNGFMSKVDNSLERKFASRNS